DPQFLGVFEMRLRDFAQLNLLLFDRKGRVNDGETEFFGHAFVFVENAALKEAKALDGIVTQAQVHASLIVFEAVSSGGNAADGSFERHAEVERHGRLDGEVVEM